MFGVGHVIELAIVLLIVVLFFGAKRLPEIAVGLRQGIHEFQKGTRQDLENSRGETMSALGSQFYARADDDTPSSHRVARAPSSVGVETEQVRP